MPAKDREKAKRVSFDDMKTAFGLRFLVGPAADFACKLKMIFGNKKNNAPQSKNKLLSLLKDCSTFKKQSNIPRPLVEDVNFLSLISLAIMYHQFFVAQYRQNHGGLQF